MCESKLKQRIYAYWKWTGQRIMLSLKLLTWIQNGFWLFRTQKNAMKLLAELEFKPSYFLRARDMHFKLENMVNVNE